jgi:hypothetical protein
VSEAPDVTTYRVHHGIAHEEGCGCIAYREGVACVGRAARMRMYEGEQVHALLRHFERAAQTEQDGA